MESEEAILENENNSNLESESGLRSRDQSIRVDGIYSEASLVTDDVPSAVDFPGVVNSNSSLEIKSADKVLTCTSIAQAGNTNKSRDKQEETTACEKSVDVEILAIAAKLAVESDSRKESILEYEDFFGASTTSQPSEVASSKVPNSVNHRLPADKDKHMDPIESQGEEDDDVVIVSHSENLLERQTAREIETMDTDGTSEPAMQTSVVNEKVEMNTYDRKSVKSADARELNQIEPSKEVHTSTGTSKCWGNDIDLLEDSQDSVDLENKITSNMKDNSISAGKSCQDEVPSLGLSKNRTFNVANKTIPDSFDISESEDVVVEDDIQDSETSNFSKKINSKLYGSDKIQPLQEMNIVSENVVTEVVGPTVLSSGGILNVSSPDNVEAECISLEISKRTNEEEVEISKQVSAPMDAVNNNDSQEKRTKSSTVMERTPLPSLLSEVNNIPGSSVKQNSDLPLGDAMSTDSDLELVEITEGTRATPPEINSHDSTKLRPPVQPEYRHIHKDGLETKTAHSTLVDATKHGNSGQKDSAKSNGSVNKTSNHHNASDQLNISEIKTECNINGSADDLVMSENEVASLEVKQELNSDKADEAEDVMVIDDDGEFVPLKKEIVELRTTKNGVDVQISGQKLHVSAEKHLETSSEPGNSKADSSKSKSAKQKLQTCIVCQKICRCKYNIVRDGDIKHLCDDACFKQFRKSPTMFLKQKGNSKAPLASSKDTAPDLPAIPNMNVSSSDTVSTQDSLYKTCSVCQIIDINTDQPFCNWKGLDFCGESCLGKFQANLNASCTFCKSYIPSETRLNLCLKIGNNMRPFCKNRCYREFKKQLRLCSFCQRDLASEPGAFTASVGADSKFIKEFCSQACMKNMQSQVNDVEVLSIVKGHVKLETITCAVCRKLAPIKYTVRLHKECNKLCSDLCLSAFQYTNNFSMGRCNSCNLPCTTEETQAHCIQHEGKVKRFCSDTCVDVFRKANSKVMPCGWCGAKKLNFDMIERLDEENKFQLLCSLKCLSLYRVSLQAKSNLAVQCDQCRKVVPAQFHLTMSDASVRNFCSYACVMNFQVQFEVQRVPSVSGSTPTQPPSSSQGQFLPQRTPGPQNQPLRALAPKGGSMATRQASSREQSPSYPVISSVVSLAEHEVNPPTMPLPQPALPATMTVAQPALPLSVPSYTAAAGVTQVDRMVPSGDGKHQIIIQAALPKYTKNKSLQCRPVMQTKATSCRPHSQDKEIQTDEVPVERVFIPVPVPVYIPMPTVMFTAPTPQIVPMPIPIPVPVFIPTTRKSVNGVCKTIKDIVERIPADPLEAELLMMAEAVAAEKSPDDSDADTEIGTDIEDFGENVGLTQGENESPTARKKDEQGDEDMLQLALKMAEEMSGPIEDLETSVQPVAVKTDPPKQQHKNVESYHNEDEEEEEDDDDDYIPSKTVRGRKAKRPNKGRPPSTRPKRQRVDREYEDDSTRQSETSSRSQSIEPPSDVNYHLKFTYGLNAWCHWVISKNMQMEKSKSQTIARARSFPTDILKCTLDELSTSLSLFVDEVRKPSGHEYSPDSIYYLCLGIQQYLYENGRIESIFTDPYFEKFTDRLNEILKSLQPKINKHGQMLCRIEEEHLWESKQLGAHSPFVLLNTLVYFHTKYFILKTVQDHMNLSFAQILKHWKKTVPLKGQPIAAAKNVSLRFYCVANGKKADAQAKKGKEGVPVYEVTENVENSLRCPVKLYEFFLSKCPEAIKNRNDIFYPVPERSCVPDSPVWYSTKPIDTHTMEKMLTRIFLVREIQEAHLHAQPIYL